MARSIHVLDETLVDKIAAGEVIERPANVVKELIDNALDARATNIMIRIGDGGRAKIEVTDNGHGMSADDAAMSVKRYATSKLTHFDQLAGLETLGFRGEALPSIAAVSELELRTRRAEDDAGTRVTVRPGGEVHVEPCGCAPGTSVVVRNLFATVPARLKFLRARQTESAAIYETCMRAALNRPAVNMEVYNEQRVVRRYPAVSSLDARVRDAFKDVSLHSVDGRRDGVSVAAVLGGSADSRRGARQLFVYVNGRAVQDRRIARAVALAYGPQLAPGMFPLGAVSIELDPALVDINAHPQKAEVRFAKTSRLLDAITKVLALRFATDGAAFWEHRLGRSGPTLSEAPQARAAEIAPLPGSRLSDIGGVPRHATSVAEPSTPYGHQFLQRIVGRAHDGRWLILETSREVQIVDRVKAIANMLHHQTIREMDHTGITRQPLLFPDRWTVSEATADAIDRHHNALQTLGFELSPLGGHVYAVRAVPAVWSRADAIAISQSAVRLFRDEAELSQIVAALSEDAAPAYLEHVRDETLLAHIDRRPGARSPRGDSAVLHSWSRPTSEE